MIFPEPKYVEFRFAEKSASGKTAIWEVVAKDENVPIGAIRWFGRWRCYAFFPSEDTIFEKTCLRDIANFCEFQTELHKKVLKVES